VDRLQGPGGYRPASAICRNIAGYGKNRPVKIMTTSTNTSSRSRGSLYLILLGCTGFVMGLYLVVTGIASAITGNWFGADGGIASFVFGVFFSATSAWLAWRGRNVRRTLRAESTLDV
jgi:hypothetical protein